MAASQPPESAVGPGEVTEESIASLLSLNRSKHAIAPQLVDVLGGEPEKAGKHVRTIRS
jgi:hypothetical protein